MINIPSVQVFVKEKLIIALKDKLQTNLDIESLYITPFNSIQLNGVYLNDRDENPILRAELIHASLEIIPLLLKNELIITDARLSDFDLYLSKDNVESPLNIQFVIDAFKSEDSSSKPKIDVKINSINIADGNVHFDLKSQPLIKDKFDPNHISVSGLNAKLALKSLRADSLNIQIKKLELEERSGLKINNLTARFITQGQHLSIKGFKLSLPKSLLQFEKFEVDYSIFRVPADLLTYAVFDSETSSSYVVLKDIAAFVPSLRHFEDRILFNTKIGGKIDSIQVKDLRLDYGDKIHLVAKGYVGDIGDKEKTFIQGNIDQLTVTTDGIIGILNNLSENKTEVPHSLSDIGTLSFHGGLSGFLKHMKATGDLHSDFGLIEAAATIKINPDKDTNFVFEGNVEANKFQLGELLKNKDIGEISFDLNAGFAKPKEGKNKISANGLVHDFIFKQYTYHDIKIDGEYDGTTINGSLFLDDPNAIFSINGLFDLSENNPKYNFDARLKNVRLDNLNLSDKYKESYFSLMVDANFSGKNIDDMQGVVKMDSITFLHSGKRLELNNFLIEASGPSSDRELSLQSDIISGKVTGSYSFSTIIESLKRSFHTYLPSLINHKENKKHTVKENNLNFDFTINNTEQVSDILKLPVTIYSPAKLVGFYDNQLERFKIEAFIPSMTAAGSKIQSGYVKVENKNDSALNSIISGSFMTKNGTLNDLSVNINAANDSVNIHTLFLNENQKKLKGEFTNTISFSRINNDLLNTDISFLPGELILNEALWQIKKSNINIYDNIFNVRNFMVNSADNTQELAIDGTFSIKNENERLNVNLKNIDLDYIFTALSIDALQFGGFANGEVYLSSIEEKPYADVNLNVREFSFNGTNLGYLELFSNLDSNSLKVNMKGQIVNENKRKTDIDGYINPITQELSINFDAEEVDISFINKYVDALFNDVQGRGSGKVHLFGDFSDVTLEGTAFIENGTMDVSLLNTKYSFTDTIYMNKDLIYFKDVSFHDEKGNIAKVNGRVVHDYFSNFMYYIDLSSTNFMLYNATESMNPMFYGTVFASGTGVIKGDEQAVDINMNIRTDEHTNVYMNFMEETAQEYSFITYKTKEQKGDSTIINNGHNGSSRLKADSGMEINMNFYVDATPDATVELLMDPVGGDRLKGAGSGALQFIWGTHKDPMLYGTYNITKGSYNFTFQKLFERKFLIQEGGFVQFRGDPFQANLDITAIYRVIANLNDLDRNLAMQAGQSNVPVNCMLNITGPLRRPNVNLDIVLPSADPEIQRQVRSIMGTEDMVNRQIVYLLLLSKFYTPNYAVTDQRTSELASLASATLSTQLSKMLSKIDDRWQIGTNIRTSDSDFSNTEVELILSSRLLNDRVLFNGNFGYRDNIQTEAFIGDIDIEVLLNRLGTWRLKAYNHYNEKYYYVRNSVQTQGIGIVYKRDFDSLRELFGRPRKKKTIIQNDAVSASDSIPDSAQFIIMKE